MNLTTNWYPSGDSELSFNYLIGLFDGTHALHEEVKGKTIDFEIKGDNRCYLSLGDERLNRGEIPLNEHGVAEIEIGIAEHGDFECTYSFSYGKHSYPYDIEVKSSSANSN